MQKTKVHQCTDMAENTAKKILKKLIDDGRVICLIDKVNPRIHHLYINGEKMSRLRTRGILLSKFEGQIKKQQYQTVPVLGVGWVSVPVYSGPREWNDPPRVSAYEILRQATTK